MNSKVNDSVISNLPGWINQIHDGSSLAIKVQPRSSKNKIHYSENKSDTFIKINITAPPVDNVANQTLIKFLSEVLNVSKSSIQITHGNTSRLKIIEIYGKTPGEVLHAIKNAS